MFSFISCHGTCVAAMKVDSSSKEINEERTAHLMRKIQRQNRVLEL